VKIVAKERKRGHGSPPIGEMNPDTNIVVGRETGERNKTLKRGKSPGAGREEK